MNFLSDEQVEDIVGAMLTGNTESGITVTYQDGDGTIDFSVASQTDNNFTNADHSKLDGIASGATGKAGDKLKQKIGLKRQVISSWHNFFCGTVS